MRAASKREATKFQLINEPTEREVEETQASKNSHEADGTAGHHDNANKSSAYCLLKRTPSVEAHLITAVMPK